MKTSRFNFPTSYPATGEELLFNTLTGAFVAVDMETAERARWLFDHPGNTSEDPDLAAFLFEHGFLVDDAMDEDAIVHERNRLGINDPNRLDVIVMPNMNCNLACTYCYEEHAKSAMSDETAAHLLSWFERMIPQFKVVLLSWFGGEPLLSYHRVVEIQQAVHQLAKDHDVVFSSHITTNGYSLSPDRAGRLLSLDLYSYQITLDGEPALHNAMRPLRGGGDTFERIMRNVCALVRMSRKVSVKLRVNYNETNLENIPRLLALFPEDVRPQLDVVYERIFGEGYSKFIDTMPQRYVGTRVEELYALAESLGFSVSMNPIEPDRLTYCYADRKSQFVINYNGDVFKCTVDKFDSKDRLGWLGPHGELTWEEKGDRVKKWHGVPAFEEKCYSCVFMPMCMGGCRKVRGREGTVGDACKLPFAGFDVRLRHRYAASRGDSIEIPTTRGNSRNYPVWLLKEERP